MIEPHLEGATASHLGVVMGDLLNADFLFPFDLEGETYPEGWSGVLSPGRIQALLEAFRHVDFEHLNETCRQVAQDQRGGMDFHDEEDEYFENPEEDLLEVLESPDEYFSGYLRGWQRFLEKVQRIGAGVLVSMG